MTTLQRNPYAVTTTELDAMSAADRRAWRDALLDLWSGGAWSQARRVTIAEQAETQRDADEDRCGEYR